VVLSAIVRAGDGMDAPERVPFAGGELVLFTKTCPGVDRPNEDALAVLPWGDDGGILVVADGVGGAPAGQNASRLAVEALRESVEEGRKEERDIRDVVISGIETANRRVREEARGSATTIAVAQIRAGRVRPYHVGDSAVLVTGQRGKVKLSTSSHSPVGYAMEAGLLDEHEAVHHDELHVVSNLVGTTDMRIEVGSPLDLAARDTLLVASDGLLDNFLPAEIVERVRKGPLAKAAAALADATAVRMESGRDGQPSKPDDLTFLLWRPAAR
jgi:protein phosphatase